MTAASVSHHRNRPSTEFRPLYLIAALYLVIALSVFGSYLLAKDLTRDMLGAGSLASSNNHTAHVADHGSLHLTSGVGGNSNGPAQVSWPKRLRSVIETKDGPGNVLTAMLSSETASLGINATAPVFKPPSAELKPTERTLFSYDLLQRPPPAN